MKINEEFINNNLNNFVQANRDVNDIKWIVIHYTANPGSTARGNAQYYQDGNTKGVSAHYFVDEHGVWRGVREKDQAGHCGKWVNTEYLTECRNGNSIGIETCCYSESGMKASQLTGQERDLYFADRTFNNLVELTKDIMNRYGIDVNHVIRHYDVHSGYKMCPRPFIGNDINTHYGKPGDRLWAEFKARLTGNTVLPATNKIESCNGTLTVKYQDNDGINLHDTADYGKHNIVGQLYKNDKRRVVNKVYLNDDTTMYRLEEGQYITTHAAYVSFEPNPLFEGFVAAVDSPDGQLAVRDFPNSAGNLLHTLSRGNLVEVLGEAYNQGDHWYYIRIANEQINLIGYASARYLQKV